MTTNRRYYRGYSLLRTDSGWEIHWGELLSSAPTLDEAESIVDSWLNAA